MISGISSDFTSSGTGADSGASGATAKTDTSQVTKNMFLQLLVAQLKNQDPLNPSDPAQFMSQLAQFQQLEQSINTGQDITATAFVVNSSDDPVTLLSASLVPVPGQRAGKLAHVAVDTSLSIIGSGRNWPPPGLPIKPLPGARIGHGQANIVFGITGSGPGFWSAAGLKITYRWPGSAYSVIAWSVDGACIRIHDCDRQGNIAENRTEKLAGHG